MHLLLSVLVALVAISIIPTVFSESLREDFAIPDWVKNNAGWWADGQIPDSAFLQGIQFLIKEEIITVQIPTVDSEAVEEVPGWVKNTVAWWAEGKIHDITFAGAIKYLLSQGIITVEQEQVEELVEETVEISDFYMEVNGDNCCQNWAYVGKDYLFQIETLDKHRGSPIDGVAITAKIISKDGELRYDFGQITTEDGFYENRLTIPSMDWYAENTLSVTGEYFGVEKTIEKEFEVFVKKNKVRICINISCYTLASVGNVVDGSNALNGVRGVAVATIGSSTYAVAASEVDDGIQIIDISNPNSPSAVGKLLDTDGTFELNGAVGLAIATIGGSTYAVVAGNADSGISIIDISTPSSPSHVGLVSDGGDKLLKNAYHVAIATIGGSTYAVVTGHADDGISIIDISTPASPVYVGELEDGTDTGKCTAVNGERCLDGPRGVAVEKINGRTYAVVAVTIDDAVTIIDTVSYTHLTLPTILLV